jgi:hypothetical protein
MDADFLDDNNPQNIKNNRGKGLREQKLKLTEKSFPLSGQTQNTDLMAT